MSMYSPVVRPPPLHFNLKQAIQLMKKKQIQERLANLSGGVAVIKVGAATETLNRVDMPSASPVHLTAPQAVAQIFTNEPGQSSADVVMSAVRRHSGRTTGTATPRNPATTCWHERRRGAKSWCQDGACLALPEAW